LNQVDAVQFKQDFLELSLRVNSKMSSTLNLVKISWPPGTVKVVSLIHLKFLNRSDAKCLYDDGK
jgi:hypothetical protein